jgi:hypothetical protein
MASTSESRRTATDYAEGGVQDASAWAGWVVFAGMMMIMLGCFQAIEGLVALFKDSYYVVRPSGLLVHVDYTTWGWVHLAIGVIAALAGFGLLAGNMFARVIGVAIAAVSALVNMAFVSAYPIWSIIIIAVDVVVIFAICVHGRELKASAY